MRKILIITLLALITTTAGAFNTPVVAYYNDNKQKTTEFLDGWLDGAVYPDGNGYVEVTIPTDIVPIKFGKDSTYHTSCYIEMWGTWFNVKKQFRAQVRCILRQNGISFCLSSKYCNYFLCYMMDKAGFAYIVIPVGYRKELTIEFNPYI